MPRPLKPRTPSTYAERIGARIRAKRLRGKWSVAEIAARANMPAQTWYAVEAGRSLTIGRLPAIAAALGCAPRTLLP